MSPNSEGDSYSLPRTLNISEIPNTFTIMQIHTC